VGVVGVVLAVGVVVVVVDVCGAPDPFHDINTPGLGFLRFFLHPAEMHAYAVIGQPPGTGTGTGTRSSNTTNANSHLQKRR
jgi:hypothetical protein